MNQPAGAWGDLSGIGAPPTPEQVAEYERHKKLKEDTDRQVASDFNATFATEPGQRVLEFLRKRVQDERGLPAIALDGRDGISVAILMAVQEGEASLYRLITQKIEKGQKL